MDDEKTTCIFYTPTFTYCSYKQMKLSYRVYRLYTLHTLYNSLKMNHNERN
jgi:hypothetical protein